jgi:hypothetical protein
MNIQKANEIVSDGFKYQHEGTDLWRVLNTEQKHFYGDCEDYGFTLLWLICDKNLKTFVDAILSGKAKMWFCITQGGKHNILQYENLFCDNIQREWKTKEYYESLQYKFKYSHSPFLILYKLAFTSIFNL